MISFTYDQVPFYISCSSSYVCCFVLIALYCFLTLRRRALFRYTLPPQVIAKQFDRFAHSCYPKGTFKLKNEILWGLTVLKNWILYMFIRWKSMRWGCILYILGLVVCLFLTLKFRQQVATDMVMVALFLHVNLNIVVIKLWPNFACSSYYCFYGKMTEFRVRAFSIWDHSPIFKFYIMPSLFIRQA